MISYFSLTSQTQTFLVYSFLQIHMCCADSFPYFLTDQVFGVFKLLQKGESLLCNVNVCDLWFGVELIY